MVSLVPRAHNWMSLSCEYNQVDVAHVLLFTVRLGELTKVCQVEEYLDICDVIQCLQHLFLVRKYLLDRWFSRVNHEFLRKVLAQILQNDLTFDVLLEVGVNAVEVSQLRLVNAYEEVLERPLSVHDLSKNVQLNG